MAESMRKAFQQASRSRQEGQFNRAAEDFAKKVGPVSPEDLQVNLEHEANPRAQALRQAASAARRRQVN